VTVHPCWRADDATTMSTVDATLDGVMDMPTLAARRLAACKVVGQRERRL
jgi:hypothetical protein